MAEQTADRRPAAVQSILMNLPEFVAKWRHATISEKSAAQSWFIDLCRVLSVQTPTDADTTGASYTFEKVASDSELKKRTLTNLCNQRPTWLKHCHAALDRAVWSAYAWPDDEIPAEVPEEVILKRLLALNLERANRSQS
jgi:hypothetical protein